MEIIQSIDVFLLKFINQISAPATDFFWLFVTKVYVWIPFILILLFFAFKKCTLKQWLFIFIASIIMVLIVFGLSEWVKVLVGRLRPSANPELNGVFRKIIQPTGYSFFSGHSATSTAVAVYYISLFKNNYKAIYLFLLWAILFMFSRLYLAVHYPSDIITGIMIGFLIAILFSWGVKKRLNWQ